MLLKLSASYRCHKKADHLSTCLLESSMTTTEPSGAEEESLKWRSGDNSEVSGDGKTVLLILWGLWVKL
jgi:hypothetical protein